MKAWIIAGLCLLPLSSWAESVLQVKGKNFLFQAGSYKNGDVLTITGPDGSSKGTARVKQAGQTKSLAEVTSGSVAAGDSVGTGSGSPSASPGYTPGRSTYAAKKKLVFGVGLGYSVSSTANLSGTITQTGITSPFSGTGKAGNGVSLTVDAQYWFTDMFGVMGGIDYEMDRPADAGMVYTSNGVAYPAYTSDGKYSNLVSLMNVLVRFGKLYLPLGINYSVVKYSSTGSVQVAGQLGYQAGAGFQFTDHISAELGYRIINFQLRVDGATTTVIYPTASLNEILLAGKFFF